MARSKPRKNRKREQETQPRARKKETKPRAKKGTVSISSRKGRLRITVPAEYSPTGEQYPRALGWDDTPENWAKAQKIADQINARIHIFKDYDPPKIAEYIFGNAASTESDPALNSSFHCRTEPELDELWKEFSLEKLQDKEINPVTYEVYYKNVLSRIHKLSTKSLNNAKVIAREIRGKYSEGTSEPTINSMSQCCEWAVKEGKIRSDPFKKLKKPDWSNNKDRDPDPFNAEGRERVPAAFEVHPEGKRYVSYIEFKFETGCRPAEAHGLRWRNVDLKKKEIVFCEVMVYTGKLVNVPRTKTKLMRIFPISPYLNKILEEIMPPQVNPDDFVFRELDGSPFNYPKFCGVWHDIVSKLAEIPYEEGGIDHYRVPYNTRHTYITETLADMARNNEDGNVNHSDVALVADRVGTSPAMIYKHYLGRSKNLASLYTSYGKKKMSSSKSKEMQPENGKTSQQSIDALVSTVAELQQQNHALQQQLDQLRSLQSASQPTAPVEGQPEPSSASETDLADLASLFTAMDELSQQNQQDGIEE